MTPLAVDPAALDGAGAAVVAVGEGLGSAISTVSAALSGAAGMAGDDPAGGALGRSYDSSAAMLIEAMVASRNGLCSIGDGVRMSAHNYSLAEAMSDVSGRCDPLPVPASTAAVSAGSLPSAVGVGTGAPAGWGWVAPYIGMIWPTGDSARLRVAAAAWNAVGVQFLLDGISDVQGPLGVVGAQQIPEEEAIAQALGESYRSCLGVERQCTSMAAQLTAYAGRIDAVRAAILDLLTRVCDPLTGIKEVWDILTDKDEDEIKKVANDIRTVVNHFTVEVDALRRQIATALSEAGTMVTTMGAYAAKQWDQFLHGTDVGRALNQFGQVEKGVLEEAGGLVRDNWTYGPLRAYVDPNGWYRSWEQMVAGMAPLVGLGGEHAPGVWQSWEDLGKDVSHWDEWKTNPAEALGKSVFDVVEVIAGGGAASKLPGLGAAARDAMKGLKSGSVPDAPWTPDVNLPHEKPLSPSAEPRLRGGTLEPGRPAAPPETKPGSAPSDDPPPHNTTESRPPAAATRAAGEPAKLPVAPPESAANFRCLRELGRVTTCRPPRPCRNLPPLRRPRRSAVLRFIRDRPRAGRLRHRWDPRSSRHLPPLQPPLYLQHPRPRLRTSRHRTITHPNRHLTTEDRI